MKNLNYNRIPFLSEADHNNRLFLLLDNDNNQIINGGFHCKDYFQEFFYNYWIDKNECEVYSFKTLKKEYNKLKNKQFVKIGLLLNKNINVNIDVNINLLNNYIKNINSKFNISINNIEVYNNPIIPNNFNLLLFKFNKKYTKYPFLLSSILYFIRTSIDVLIFNEDNLDNIVDKLFNQGIIYIPQHIAMKKILNDNKIIDFIRNTNWKFVEERIIDKERNEKYYISLHNRSGFVTGLKNYKYLNKEINE